MQINPKGNGGARPCLLLQICGRRLCFFSLPPNPGRPVLPGLSQAKPLLPSWYAPMYREPRLLYGFFLLPPPVLQRQRPVFPVAHSLPSILYSGFPVDLFVLELFFPDFDLVWSGFYKGARSQWKFLLDSVITQLSLDLRH